MADSTDESDGRKQKSLYAEYELAGWIEDVADKDDRSESYVLNEWLEQMRQSVDGEVIDFSDTTAVLQIDD